MTNANQPQSTTATEAKSKHWKKKTTKQTWLRQRGNEAIKQTHRARRHLNGSQANPTSPAMGARPLQIERLVLMDINGLLRNNREIQEH